MKKSNSNELGLGAAVGKLEKHLQEGLAIIKAVQDEAILELNLGKMDLKQRWTELGAELSKAEHEALQRAPPALDHAIKALHSLRNRASKGPAKKTPASARR
jgi:hypothetical protein